MTLTDDQWHILLTHRGNTAESQSIRRKLYAKTGRKFCGICCTIKAGGEFAKDGRTLNGRPRSLGGTCSVCRACDNCRKPRARRTMVHFEFEAAERNARYRGRMSPAERSHYDARGYAQTTAGRPKQRRDARIALGMTPRQAEYREDWSLYADVWADWIAANPARNNDIKN